MRAGKRLQEACGHRVERNEDAGQCSTVISDEFIAVESDRCK